MYHCSFFCPWFCILNLRFEMASHDKETLHTYLRRHFEKVSKINAKQFAEMMEDLKGVSDVLASQGNTK